MGAASSKPAYLTLAYDRTSILILRPPTLALACDKAVELFAFDLTSTGQQVHLLLDGVQLSDEVWDVVTDGTKLQVELAGKRRRVTTEGDGEHDPKRVPADSRSAAGSGIHADDHLHSCEDCDWGKESTSMAEPSRDVKGKGKEKAVTSIHDFTPADLDLLRRFESYQGSNVHQPGCHHFGAEQLYDDEDDQSVVIVEHTSGCQWRIPFVQGSEMTLGALLRAVEKKTGESREAWTLVTEKSSELDPDREWKALSRWGIEEGSRIRLVYEGQLIVFAIVLEPRNTFLVEALTTDTVGDIKKKLSLQVSTPPTDFILADWSDVVVPDEDVLGDYTGSYDSCASVSFSLWDPEEFKKYLIKKKSEEAARQLRISAAAEGSAIQGPAPKEQTEVGGQPQGEQLDEVDAATHQAESSEVGGPSTGAPTAVDRVGDSSAMETEVGGVQA